MAADLLWPWLEKIPVGRLPGDFVIDRRGFRFYFPLTTMVLVVKGAGHSFIAY